MAGKLVGQVALVTGASSGIGEATAIALAAEGAKVVVVARRRARLDALAQRIQQQGGTLLPIMADIADETQVREVVSQTQAQFGRIDCLINNAGLMLLGMIDESETPTVPYPFAVPVRVLLKLVQQMSTGEQEYAAPRFQTLQLVQFLLLVPVALKQGD